MSPLEQLAGAISNLKAGQKKWKAGQTKLEIGQKTIRKDIREMQFELKSGVWDEMNRLYHRMEDIEKKVGLS